MGAAPDCGGPLRDLTPAAAAAAMDEVEEDYGDRPSMAGGGDPNWWPPGFRFHPTDEELVLYYLKRKVCGRRIKPSMIGDVDVYKLEPWELPDKSLLRSRDKQWYYFSPRDRKYPNGSRSNRATKHGYWKATGKDRTISHNSKAVGNKKTLVYYHGRPPKGERTDWVMHEYTMDEKVLERCSSVQDYFALYKLFRKSGPGPKNGEQYGAPFREEEWEEDVPDDNFMNYINMGDQSKEHLQFQSVDRVSNVVGERLPNYDIENMLLQMSDELDVVPQHSEYYSLNDDARADNLRSGTDKCMQTTEHIQNHLVNRIVNEDTNTLPNFDLEDILLQMSNELDVAPEANITVNPLSYQDDLFIQQTDAKCEHGSVMTSFHNTSAAANVQPIEMPKMTSLTGSSVQGQNIADEEFLEIKDLNDLDSLNWGTEEISNNDHIPVSGGLIDTDDYFDAQMFPAEATGPGHVINQYSWWDDLGGNGRHSQTSHLTTEFWTDAQSHNASTALVPSSASSGLAFANDSQPDDGLTLGEMNNVGTPSESWFNSALLAFLDSVPSSPALASENTLISRALERVSSFRTGQTQEAGGLPATKGSSSSTINRREGNRNGGFLFISFLVGVGAIFSVLTTGAALKLTKVFWGRFVSS